ncbi:MAG: efflux RND transporter periplasmic adaptor subunit, partial [Bdellovibrionota bacterium]
REGETIFAQTAIMTLVDLADTYLLVSLEQTGMLKVRTGQAAAVSFDGYRDKSFEGAVESVYSNGVDFLARISVKGLPPFIVPGMTADVAIVLQKKENVLLAPVAAIEGSSLSVFRSGREAKVPVKVGLTDGAYAEIVDGDIKEGESALLSLGKTK